MGANKYALIRYRIIDKCLTNKHKPFPSKEDLRFACEENLFGSSGERISESTIEKDLWAMRNEGELGYYAPIKFSKPENGYYYEDSKYSIDSLRLNDNDLEAIRFATSTLYQFRNIPVFKQFDYAISKIFDRLSITPQGEDHEVDKFVQFETHSKIKGGEYLGSLLNCIKEKKQIKFSYENFVKGAIKEHLVDPYLLKEYRNRWYLIGFDSEKKSILTFGLDRILGLKVTNFLFSQPEDFNPDHYFKNCIGITASGNVPETITLLFDPVQGKYIKSQPIHESQKILKEEAVGLLISLNVIVTIELIMQILSYGPKVTVVSPLHLKNQIKDTLKSSLENYMK